MDAVKMMKNLVSLSGISQKVTNFGIQMHEYRARSQNSVVAEDGVPRPSAPQPPSPTEAYALEDLASQYGIKDMMNMGADAQQLEQSVDEEFAAYTASTSPKHTDVIKFWEVSR
jgi:hypothetical protein